jgi:hypothetical protein
MIHRVNIGNRGCEYRPQRKGVLAMSASSTPTREKFNTQVKPEIVAEVRKMAKQEGRQLQALVEEALVDLIAKHRNARPRPHVMAAHLASVEKFGALYKKLAE